MKITLPAGSLKRFRHDPIAVERNIPRVRRHEPVFIIEHEVGDKFVELRAVDIAVNGEVTTQYGQASGFTRFVTNAEVVYDDGLEETEATTPAAPKAGKTPAKKGQ